MHKDAADIKGSLINEDVIKDVFHRYFDELCRFLGYYSRDEQLIEDCLQDVFVKLWEDRATINIFHVKAYLYRAARNRIYNAVRNANARLAHREMWFREEMEREYAEECVDMEEFSRYYNEAVQALPDQCRRVYLHCKEARKSHRQVAEDLQLSVKTVENQITIAHRKIRAYIATRIVFPNV